MLVILAAFVLFVLFCGYCYYSARLRQNIKKLWSPFCEIKDKQQSGSGSNLSSSETLAL